LATRSYRPGEHAPISDATEILGEHAHKISVDQLIPRIAERSKKAGETIPLPVYFYAALRAGRRCSCFDIETSPDGQCEACFGSGTVGGYEKYGTTVEVVDVTRPNLRTSNVMPDWSARRKPIPFTLIKGALRGVVEGRIHLTTNTNVVDALAAEYEAPAGTTIAAYVRAPSDTEYVVISKKEIAQRLANPWIDIRITMERSTAVTPSPILKAVYLRYQNFTENKIVVNIPRVQKSIAMQEFGVMDDYSTINFFLDNRLKSITTEDFFVSVEGDTRWKIITVKPNAPHGQLTSWDADVRLAQENEPYLLVP